MIPYQFNYKRAASVDDAVALLIDISKIKALNYIRAGADAVAIGAGTTHFEVATSAAVAKAIPALAHTASVIGDPAVRYKGTLGGSVANNDPAADYPAAVLGLGATIKTNARSIAADDFFQGLFTTALETGEIVTEVSFPVPAKAAYKKFANPASRYAMAGAFVAKMKDDSVRVAITGAGPCVFRVPQMEAALAKSFTPDAIAKISVDPSGLNSDIHGSAEYRANLVTVMAKRAVAEAA
jgi:aerobic carbon-monoxide dehydrogenase medium subunit